MSPAARQDLTQALGHEPERIYSTADIGNPGNLDWESRPWHYSRCGAKSGVKALPMPARGDLLSKQFNSCHSATPTATHWPWSSI